MTNPQPFKTAERELEILQIEKNVLDAKFKAQLSEFKCKQQITITNAATKLVMDMMNIPLYRCIEELKRRD